MREPKTMGLQAIVEKQKAFFDTDATKSVEFRVRMLRRLENAIRRQENEILLALHEDLSKSKAEAYMTELAMVYGEIHEAIRHVRQWSHPKRVGGTLSTFPAKNYIYAEPYGVVLILAPWNYPFNLTMAPLTAAIAAGNCAVVKCSKESSRTAQVMGSILRSAFGENYVYCADAGIGHDEVLHQSYDYIFFTGSPRVGRIVMRAASERLTPVSLELGGKSPCIIDETANIALAAKRVAWGKLLNAGQTCISVDYVLVHERVKQAFLKALQREIARRYPDAANDPDYPKIINRHHYQRLSALMKTEKTMRDRLPGSCAGDGRNQGAGKTAGPVSVHAKSKNRPAHSAQPFLWRRLRERCGAAHYQPSPAVWRRGQQRHGGVSRKVRL